MQHPQESDDSILSKSGSFCLCCRYGGTTNLMIADVDMMWKSVREEDEGQEAKSFIQWLSRRPSAPLRPWSWQMPPRDIRSIEAVAARRAFRDCLSTSRALSLGRIAAVRAVNNLRHVFPHPSRYSLFEKASIFGINAFRQLISMH